MFRKVLIANRGEIACRIITTAQRMGVGTVSVFSDADKCAHHVQMADEAVRIGSAAAAESYLSVSGIIEAALKTGADAIHPGYGFLSENPAFAEAADASGLAFIGPPAPAIRAMGLKDAAKRLMEDAGVPVVSGYHDNNQDTDFLASEADRAGYPILIKARAGGGGKGMRLVQSADDFCDALSSARREALASFGDPACLIEKYVERPRHIEIQILGDSFGNMVHLFERDCSLQRRHQKVIEEAPAPGMTDEMRAAMTGAAVSAARAIGYQNAGTVEFIVDASEGLHPDRFWFMEMNTRLQVEHPVTEAITGLDLVELQFHIAAGERLPFSQDNLAISGHSIEARLYAEDPANDFLPATGKLHHLSFPEASAFRPGRVRVDSGVRQGDEISPWYDPMIAKLIVHGTDRQQALQQLAQALSECQIAGTVANAGFLSALARHPGFTSGAVDTGLIARETGSITAFSPLTDEVIALAALTDMGFLAPIDDADIRQRLRGWRHWSSAEVFSTFSCNDEHLECRIACLPDDTYRIERDTASCEIQITERDPNAVRYSFGGVSRRAAFFKNAEEITLFLPTQTLTFRRPDPFGGHHYSADTGDTIITPMPGVVKRVHVEAGQYVANGAPLTVLEAMKMEHTLKAPRDARIAQVHVAEGDQIAGRVVLITLEAEGSNG